MNQARIIYPLLFILATMGCLSSKAATIGSDSISPCVIQYPSQPKSFNWNLKDRLWPDGVVTFYLDFDQSDHGKVLTRLMRDAATKMSRKTNTCWVEKPHGEGAVKITHSSTAINSALLGYPGPGNDRSTIAMIDESEGIGLHEMGHILGLLHEQQRPDRNNFVRINYDNIAPGRRSQFDLPRWLSIQSVTTTPYDFGSIMHYHPYAFSINSRPTISLASGKGIPTSHVQQDSLSELDIKGINTIYAGIGSEACETLQADYQPARINIKIEIVKNSDAQEFCRLDEVQLRAIPGDGNQSNNTYSWNYSSGSQRYTGGPTFSPKMVRTGSNYVYLTVRNADELRKYSISINTKPAEEFVTIIGNPISLPGRLRFRVAAKQNDLLTRLVSSAGSIVYSAQLSKTSCKEDLEITPGDLPPGVYALQVRLGDRWANQKFVVQ